MEGVTKTTSQGQHFPLCSLTESPLAPSCEKLRVRSCLRDCTHPGFCGCCPPAGRQCLVFFVKLRSLKRQYRLSELSRNLRIMWLNIRNDRTVDPLCHRFADWKRRIEVGWRGTLPTGNRADWGVSGRSRPACRPGGCQVEAVCADRGSRSYTCVGTVAQSRPRQTSLLAVGGGRVNTWRCRSSFGAFPAVACGKTRIPASQ